MTKRIWSKKAILREALLGIASRLGPGERMPTVAKLCESLSVSNATLDGILRELEEQGAIIREHGRGIFVSDTIHHKTIGVVFGGNIFSPGYSPFWSLLLQAVRDQSAARKFVPRTYMDISGEQGGLDGHRQLTEDLAAHRLDGLLLIAPHHEYDEAAELREHGIPLVAFTRPGQGWTVTHDFDRFMRLAVQQAAQIGAHHIGLIASPEHRPAIENELRQAGLHDFRIDDWSYETWARRIPGAGTHENCAHRLTQQMIANAGLTPLPDTVISTEDTATRGMITALLQAGLKPGDDMRIITSANLGSPLLDPYAHDLTQIAFDPAEDVRAMLDMLDTLMRNSTPSQNPILIAPALQTTKQGANAPMAAQMPS